MSIENLTQLRKYLQVAIELEHSTIPPYLYAMYSIHPGTNNDSYYQIRAVVVEEMLHMTLAANMMNAIGGTPNVDRPDFIPEYPTYLPCGETDFEVHLRRFSPEAVETFLMIERPTPENVKRVTKAPVLTALRGRMAVAAGNKLVKAPRQTRVNSLRKRIHALPGGDSYETIGEFYTAISKGFDKIFADLGPKMFSGKPERQVTSEYYYSSGGALFGVYNIADAHKAIKLIMDQGEGTRDSIFDGVMDVEGKPDLAHYYRFMQIREGRYYQQHDKASKPPTGPPLPVDYTAVYNVKTDLRQESYPKGSEAGKRNHQFNRNYTEFLRLIDQAFNGEPSKLVEGVGRMFILRNEAEALMRNPMPGMEGHHAGPSFQYAPADDPDL